jgi:hypothetical protein
MDMRRRIVLGYFAASIAAMVVSDWALLYPSRSVFSFFSWIFLGPIGIAGFVTLGRGWSWPIAIELFSYYAIATLVLGGSLWLMPKERGVRRYLTLTVMVAVWLVCCGYIFWQLSWAA